MPEIVKVQVPRDARASVDFGSGPNFDEVAAVGGRILLSDEHATLRTGLGKGLEVRRQILREPLEGRST